MFFKLVSFLLGCSIGSFLNVVVYRLPNKMNLSFPGSSCPLCNNKIKWYDNIPIFSFLILRGKCRKCKTKISIKYPLIEFLTGVMFLLVYLKFDYSLETLKYFLFLSFLIPIAFIDLKNQYIPDRLNGLLLLSGILFSLVSINMLELSIIGSAVFSFPFLLIYGYSEAILKKEALGFGDVKLVAGIGSFLLYKGLYNVYIFITLSFVIGAIVSLSLIRLNLKSRNDRIAFAPYIVLSALIMMFIQ